MAFGFPMVNAGFTDSINKIFIVNKDTNAIQTIDNAKTAIWIDSTHVLYHP